jgi:hypothetical protein
MLGAQGQLAGRMATASAQQQRDAQMHQYRMNEIEAKGTRDASGAAISPAGIPNSDRVDYEIRNHGNLIPWGTADAVSGNDVTRRQGEAKEIAESFLNQPTSEIEGYIAKKPSDKWTPFLRAVVQSRSSVGGGMAGMGAVPEGGARMPGALGNTEAQLGGTQRDASSRFGGISEAELNALASDPGLLEQYWNGGIK